MSANCLGIIPARGGSKSIPRKNMTPLGGKPLIAWTFEAALKSAKLDRVILSTDDQEIAEMGLRWGIETPFLRPRDLAEDDTPTLPVLQHAVQWLESKQNYLPNIVTVLQPTSPLRRPEHIDQAIEMLIESGADSVVSVCLSERSPYWMKRLEGNRIFPFVEKAPEYTRRQDLPPVYRLNGAVYATHCDVLMKQNLILGEDTRAIIMDAESSVDIDSPLDLTLAEIILSQRKYE